MDTIDRQAQVSLARILPRLEGRCAAYVETPEWATFSRRLRNHFEALFRPLVQLYGAQYDFFYHPENIVEMAAHSWLERPQRLRARDEERDGTPDWFQSQRMLGAMCYVDLFAGTLDGVRAEIPYLKELGVTYLHLMP